MGKNYSRHVEEIILKHYVGASYDIENAGLRTTDDLASFLEGMAADVRKCRSEDKPVEIAEVSARDGKITYILKKSILRG